MRVERAFQTRERRRQNSLAASVPYQKEIVHEHFETNLWILLSGNADEADLTRPPWRSGASAAPCKNQIGITFPDDFMDLPETQVIGLQPPQGFLQRFAARDCRDRSLSSNVIRSLGCQQGETR